MSGIEDPAIAELAGRSAGVTGLDTDPLVCSLYAQCDVPIPSSEDAITVLARLMAAGLRAHRNRDRAYDPAGARLPTAGILREALEANVIRVLVAEDMRILRDTLVALLRLEDGIEVVA